ncbi:MAG: hypothetical protein JO037_00135 [Actinobacteria bacterium]|nr:hypothetical protein [Actinomycetota bacterium]
MTSTGMGPGAADLLLLRRYEPVLRFTRGELFLPMPVEAYLEACSLWRSPGHGRASGRPASSERLCAPGELTPGALARAGAGAPAGALWMRFVQSPLGRREYRAWRRDPGRMRSAPRGSRFAAVGLLARLIDAVLRLSLLLRGRVPGGTAAAAEQIYRARAAAQACPYYGRVVRDRGFVVLQYWFFYAMNDWRSTFAGVNDHEADWEQVSVFLPDPPDPGMRPAWVACSSHDEVGDDLRRRPDDPDLTWQDTHLIVFAGAGSHSGAYLPGDYLITVEPPALKRVLGVLRRGSRLLFPWTRHRAGPAYGIPFIDYHRGDGPGVGPGEQREWCPVLIDDETPWVRDYRGLWGLDTGDPLGGERAPAGPRYERSGLVRTSWSDPVAWAGLDKEPPSAEAAQQAVKERIGELDAELSQIEGELGRRGDELRRARAGARALAGSGLRGDTAALAALDASVGQVRARHRLVTAERDALIRASVEGLPPEGPHAHLRHRALPNVYPARTRGRVLRAWSAVSAALLLAGLAVIVYWHADALLPALAGLAVVMLSAEAFARGHLIGFIAGLVAAAAVVIAAWAVITAALANWRPVVAGLLTLAAVVVLLVNIRDFFVKR